MKFFKFWMLTSIAALCTMLVECGKPSAPSTFTENDKAEIMRILDVQAIDWSDGDLEKFMKGYWKSDSMQFIGKSGIRFGWQPTLENYRKNFPDTVAMGKLRYEILKINPVSSDAVYLKGKFFLTRTIGDMNGIFTLVFRKIDGLWLIVYDHTS